MSGTHGNCRVSLGCMHGLGAGSICNIGCSKVAIDSQAFRFRGGVDVRSKEEEVPALLLLRLDESLDLRIGEVAACILHTVGGDNHDGVLGYVVFGQVLVDFPDMLDRTTDSIEQCSAPTDEVLVSDHRGYFRNCQPIMQGFDHIVEEHRGNQGFTGLLLMRFQGRIEAADGIVFQTLHGSASIDDENQFGQTLLHDCSFLLVGGSESPRFDGWNFTRKGACKGKPPVDISSGYRRGWSKA